MKSHSPSKNILGSSYGVEPKEWNLYWMRASGKWELYDPFPESTHLGKIIEIINEDKHGCFHG